MYQGPRILGLITIMNGSVEPAFPHSRINPWLIRTFFLWFQCLNENLLSVLFQGNDLHKIAVRVLLNKPEPCGTCESLHSFMVFISLPPELTALHLGLFCYILSAADVQGNFSSHSFHIAVAKVAARNGILHHKMQMLECWTSTAYLSYICTPAELFQ